MHRNLWASLAMLFAAPIFGAVAFATAASAQTVTIADYVNGAPATESSAGDVSLPMTATWTDPNVNGGAAQSGQFTLDASGYNNSNPYEATTNDMSVGSDYSADLNSFSSCSANYPFTLEGYSTGDTLQDAADASVNTTPPSFTDLQGDEYEIVWLETCPPAPAPTSPANGASLTSDQYAEADWNAVTDPATPISYYYEVSNSSATNADGSLQTPIYESGALTSTSVPTTDTAAGTYYWIVRAEDAAGNYGPWSSPSEVIVTSSSTGTTPPPTENGAGEISGEVFGDANGNGTLDSGESGIPNWPVYLANSSGIIASSTTDSNGDYSFTNLVNGTYIVLSTYQQNYIPTVYPKQVRLNDSNTDIANQNFGEEQVQTTTTPPQGYGNGNESSGYGSNYGYGNESSGYGYGAGSNETPFGGNGISGLGQTGPVGYGNSEYGTPEMGGSPFSIGSSSPFGMDIGVGGSLSDLGELGMNAPMQNPFGEQGLGSPFASQFGQGFGQMTQFGI